MVYVCNIKTSANTILHQSNTNIDIDDIISQLLTSQKFDELAEKVADKAVNKIKGIDKPVLRFERFTASNNDSFQDNYRESFDKNYKKETPSLNTNLKNEAKQLPKLVKINTEAIMKKKVSEQSENLRLKYKYLTRNAQKSDVHKSTVLGNVEAATESTIPHKKPEIKKQQQLENNTVDHSSHQDATENNTNKDADDISSKYENTAKDRIDDNPKKNSHDIHSDVDDTNDDNTKIGHSREDGPKPVSEKVSEVKKAGQELIKNVVNTNIKKLKVKENEEVSKSRSSTEEDIKELENLEKRDKSSEKSKEEEGEEDFKASKEESEKSDSSEEAGEDNGAPMFRADDNNDPDVDDNKVTLDYQGNPEVSQEKTIPKKPILRKEGNKIYAFVEGTDYEEYHEQYAKMQKDKAKIPVFPIL